MSKKPLNLARLRESWYTYEKWILIKFKDVITYYALMDYKGMLICNYMQARFISIYSFSCYLHIFTNRINIYFILTNQ